MIFYIAYQQWAAWFLLMAAVWLPIFSLIVSLPAMLTTQIRLDMPRAVGMGKAQEVSIRCICRFPAPPWRCKLTVRRLLTGEEFLLRERDFLPTAHCGTLAVAPQKARVYDYLGLFKLPARLCPQTLIVVRPVPVPIAGLHVPELALEKSWRPKPGGGLAENHELRLYRPGDSIQQIHWKLSAKTGKLILREPMEPIRGRVLVRLDLTGTSEELDRRFGQLLWLGRQLNEKNLSFQVQCLTASGLETRHVAGEMSLRRTIDELLACPKAVGGPLQSMPQMAAWQFYIGGGADEG